MRSRTGFRGSFVLGGVLAATLSAGAMVFAQAAAQVPVRGATIDEKTLETRRAVACVGNQKVEISKALIKADSGVAVSATGSCTITIKDSRIVGSVALQLVGTTVTVENSIIEGAMALQMTGGAVSFKQSTIKGGIQRVGGTISDLGNNLGLTPGK